MKPSQGITGRIWQAIKQAEASLGHKIAQALLAEWVSRVLSKRPPYTQNAASSWIRKGARDVDVLWGLAIALGVRPEWLAFGEEPMVEHQVLPPGVQEIPVEAFERMPRHIRRRKKA